MSRMLIANLRNTGSQCSVFARFARSMEAISVQLNERTVSIKPAELINERHVQQHAGDPGTPGSNASFSMFTFTAMSSQPYRGKKSTPFDVVCERLQRKISW